ncbi:phosphotriesterase-related protein [Escherichia coli]|nr:phosphotriesterase-related protein [Escherichia coli]
MSIDPTGYTLAHEHLHIDLSGFKNNVDCRLDQYAFICQEMNDLMTRGVRNVIEMTNRYMGRNAQFMLDVMRETGINVVACTGYYQDAFFPEHVATRSVQELAQEMVDEIEQGIDGTDLKAGIIAEIGSSEGKITPLEEKVFIAAALAHNQTGRPISTHTSFSTMGLEQLALLQAHGVDLSRVTVGHCDLKDNLDNILKMIDLGAYVQFDTIGKNSYYPDEKRIAMLHALRDRGLLNRVMLSMDITRRSHLKANGGYGYDYLLTTFIPQLRQSGFSQADVDVSYVKIPLNFSNKDRLMKKIGVAGLQREQIKKTIEATAPGSFEVFIHNDMEAAMKVKSGQLDYYIGACNTGAGAALSIAIAVIGYNKSCTIAKPGIKAKDEHIAKMIAEGKVAFGLSVEHVEHAIPMLINHLK